MHCAGGPRHYIPQTIKQYRVTLPIIGLCARLFVCRVRVVYGKVVLEMSPIILRGIFSGNLTTTAALYSVNDAAESSTPVPGYTVSYAIFNEMLTFLGPVVVFAV